MSSYLFTSESVSEGHPDKVADQISDAVLDAILAQDPRSRVAAETLVKDNLVVLAGEITTGAHVNFAEVARKTIKRIGYNDPAIGFDTSTCTVIVAYGEQSQDIAKGVDEGKGLDLEQGAGDQGLMFGYACDETPELMPLPIYLAHRLVERQSEVRRDGRLPWLRPDAKSQVTIRYVDGRPDSIETAVLSTQHAPGLKHEQIKEAVIEQVIKPVLPRNYLKGKISYLVNPTGSFEIGGPKGDCGLTGRKMDRRRKALRTGAEAFRPAPEGHHPDARPAASHLRENRRLRPLRPRRARVHLGSNRQGDGACRGRGREERRSSRRLADRSWNPKPAVRRASSSGNRMRRLRYNFAPPQGALQRVVRLARLGVSIRQRRSRTFFETERSA